jgi:hypothetical protein
MSSPRRIRRRQCIHDQKKKIIVYGWIDYKGEVLRFED